MSTLFGGPGAAPDRPIQSEADLLDLFRSGEKPHDRFGIGIEYERLPVSRETGLAVPYAAAPPAPGRPARPSVEAVLEAMAARRGWRAEREQGRIIALERDGTRVTLEPGAQVELSGRVHRDLAAAYEEIIGFVREVEEISAPMGVALLPLGCQPFSEFTGIEWVPKGRYGIMAPYLASRGHLSHGMMKATAGCQINLDYASETDALEKLRVATRISPIVTALCANSPLTRGQANGFLSRRSHIWMHTDPDRCGLLDLAWKESAGYADYADYALDVPMLFVVREGRWLDMTGRTFRAYLGGASGGLTPTRADWELHLTTLFPEARLKSYVEVRGSDSGPPEMIAAQAALWKGILYDAGALRAVVELTGRVTPAQLRSFHRAAVRTGLAAPLVGRSGLAWARDLVGIAGGALPAAETAFLEPLRRIVLGENATPAERLLVDWRGPWRLEPRRLVAALCEAPPAAP